MRELPLELRTRLARIPDERGIPGVPSFVADRGHGKGLWAGPIAGLGMTALAVTLAVFALPQVKAWWEYLLLGVIVPPFALWGPLAVLETVRALSSRSRPFQLVTPRVYVEAGYDHGDLVARRLADATGSGKTEKYDSNQKYEGREFRIEFPRFTATILARTPDEIARMEEVFAAAQQGTTESAGLELVPATPPRTSGAWADRWHNPYGTLWILLGALAIILLFAGFILGRIFGR